MNGSRAIGAVDYTSLKLTNLLLSELKNQMRTIKPFFLQSGKHNTHTNKPIILNLHLGKKTLLYSCCSEDGHVISISLKPHTIVTLFFFSSLSLSLSITAHTHRLYNLALFKIHAGFSFFCPSTTINCFPSW